MKYFTYLGEQKSNNHSIINQRKDSIIVIPFIWKHLEIHTTWHDMTRLSSSLAYQFIYFKFKLTRKEPSADIL